jgi:putative transposase
MNKMELHDVLRKVLSADEPDVLRELMKVFLEALMGAEADSACGASYGERSDERVNSRNGYRDRDFDSRVGTVALDVPKLRKGSYYPDWLLERRRRAERALTAVIAECYVKGVSTRRVDGIVKTLGIEGISSSQVSRMAKSLDTEVEAFRSRPLDGDAYPYVWLDAISIRVREAGRVSKITAMVATAVNADGQREILGVETSTEETGAAWTTLRRSPGRLRPPQGTDLRDRRRAAGSVLAEVPHALHAQPAHEGPEVCTALRGHPRALGLRATLGRRGLSPARPGRRAARREVRRRSRDA